MNAGKYGRSSAALKELLALDPTNMEARRLFATLHLRLGNLLPAKHAFDSLIDEAFQRQDYWLAESLLREYLATAQRCVPFLEKLGSIYQEKGDALEAATEYGKAIDILIEDPDPENPQHASQLYAKIRDLAPVSLLHSDWLHSLMRRPANYYPVSLLKALNRSLPPHSTRAQRIQIVRLLLDRSTERCHGSFRIRMA
ncbi:MAG: tetratricopeptide repeat protein [Nitrospira sp.]|nr:tetratricopeptide repeat protein [Nitrospira sp.]